MARHIFCDLMVLKVAMFMIVAFQLSRTGTRAEETGTQSEETCTQSDESCIRIEKTNQGLSEMIAWARANGGQVSDKLVLKDTFHDGMKVRSLVTEGSIPESEVIMLLPDNLTIRAEHYPELDKAILPDMCNTTENALKDLKHAISFAYELSKGDSSFYAPYLRMLPSLDDYKSYHPVFAAAELLQSLETIPIVEMIQRSQSLKALLQTCWDQWKQDPTCPHAFRALPWTDVLLGLSHLESRAFTHGDSCRLVPIADFMNTGLENQNNVELDDEEQPEEFILRSAWELEPGEELLDPYLDGATTNRILVAQYGVYIEGGMNSVKALPLEECPISYQQFVRDTLEHFQPGGEMVPRCNQKILEHNQGFLHCSLARITYEYCGEAWQWRKMW